MRTLKDVNAWAVFGLFLSLLVSDVAIAIAMGGHNATLRDFSMSRGWDNFMSLFGGLGGLLLAVICTIGVTGLVIRASFADLRETWEKVATLVVSFVLIGLAVAYGQDILHGFAEGQAYYVLVFLGLLASQTGLSAWIGSKVLA